MPRTFDFRWLRSTAPLVVVLSLLPSLSCSLLEPYPNGENPVDQLFDPAKGTSGITDGTVQTPLRDPQTDSTVTVDNALAMSIESALPGGAFKVKLNFIAPGKNVVGGGISLEGSKEVQWTFLEGVFDVSSGQIVFSFSVGTNVCDDVPPLCHPIKTQQYAVSKDAGGNFLVSKPVEVTIVLQCASCESESCSDIFTELGHPEQCRACEQPSDCAQLYTACYAPGAPSAGTTESDIFNAFFAERGVMWTGQQTCLSGAPLCKSIWEQGDCKFPKTSYFAADVEAQP